MITSKVLSQADYCARLTAVGISLLTAEVSYRTWRATVYGATEGVQRGTSAGWRETRSRSQQAAIRAMRAWWSRTATGTTATS